MKRGIGLLRYELVSSALSRVLKGRLTSSVELLFSNALANAVLFAGTYFLSKIVSPSDFGKYSLLIAIALTLYPILTLRYEQAIPLATSNHVAKNLFISCLVISTGSTIFALIFSSLLREYLIPITQDKLEILKFSSIIWFVCLSQSLFAIAQAVILRAGMLRKLAIGRVFRACTLTVLQIGLVILISQHAYSLIIGDLVATLLVSVLLLREAPIDLIRPRKFRLNSVSVREKWRKMRAILRYYRDFAVISCPHAFVHQAALALYGIVIGWLYGVAVVGQYYFMRKIIFGVTALLSAATNQVGVSEASAAKGNSDRLREVYRYIICVVGIVTVPVAASMFLFGHEIFTFIFGDKWGDAGRFAGAATLLIVVEPIASAIAFIPQFKRKQGRAFIWSITQNSLALIALLVVYAGGGGAFVAILSSSLTLALVLIAYLVWAYKLCG